MTWHGAIVGRHTRTMAASSNKRYTAQTVRALVSAFERDPDVAPDVAAFKARHSANLKKQMRDALCECDEECRTVTRESLIAFAEYMATVEKGSVDYGFFPMPRDFPAAMEKTHIKQAIRRADVIASCGEEAMLEFDRSWSKLVTSVHGMHRALSSGSITDEELFRFLRNAGMSRKEFYGHYTRKLDEP